MSSIKNSFPLIVLIGLIILVTIYIIMNPKSNTSQTKNEINPSAITDSVNPENTTWELINLFDTNKNTQLEIPTQTKITLLMSESKVSGNSGCNNYMGSYVLNGNEISFSQMGSTMMFCGEEIGEIEGVYLSNLQIVKTFTSDENNLIFYNEKNQEILNYSKSKTATLENQDWIATMVNNGKEAVIGIPEDISVTARFENGTVSGNAGCNNYNGSYELDGNNIKFGEIASTMMYCEGPASEVESNYLIALQNSDNYVFENGRLVLKQGETRQVDYVNSENE